jgi:hypothetical protein
VYVRITWALTLDEFDSTDHLLARPGTAYQYSGYSLR